jgi:hypothetical protein
MMAAIGITLVAIGLCGVADFLMQNVWLDVKGWLLNGGAETIVLGGRNVTVSARGLACVFCALPPALLLSGLMLSYSAFRRGGNNDV